MKQPEDDTPQPPEADEAYPVAGEPRSKGSYYYDDRTGYEVYEPDEDEE